MTDTERSRSAFDGWLKCGSCGSENVRYSFNNGRFRLKCEEEECRAGFSKLIGKHRFRRSIGTEGEQ